MPITGWWQAAPQRSARRCCHRARGEFNRAQGDHSVATGRRAQALHDGSFVFADRNDFDFVSEQADEFAARATGGARFVSAVDGAGNPTAGVRLLPGGNDWAILSMRASKTGFEAVEPRQVLESVAALPIMKWSYTHEPASLRHMGPTAEDFHFAFGLGSGPKYLTSTDVNGVSLAALKGLYEMVREQARRLAELEEQNRELALRLARLEECRDE